MELFRRNPVVGGRRGEIAVEKRGAIRSGTSLAVISRICARSVRSYRLWRTS